MDPIVLAWWPLIQADTFLYHDVLQASALKLECLKRSPNAFHYETYSRESIETLRQRVKDPRAGVSDHTIGAVAALAALAVRP
jgi:sialic acid synthase SpsE